MPVQKRSLLDLSPEELRREMTEAGEQAYRAAQVLRWIFRGAASFSQMTDLPLDLRTKLEEKYDYPGIRIEKKEVSERDASVKFAMRLSDGNLVESVLMRYRYGDSLCLSTQVGCRMGCVFCASAGLGFIRNLTAAEMEEQVLAVAGAMEDRVSRIVFMGIGEPLDNLDQVLEAIHRMNDPSRLGIGARHITLSTCGLIPGMDRLAAEKLPLTLSVSLHAPEEALRRRLMPVAGRTPLKALIAACRRYREQTGRRITLEYVMIRDVNDSPEMARSLVRLLGGGSWHVNLIPLHETPRSEFRASRQETVRVFRDILEAGGILVTLRRSLGSDITAACGQLRRGMLDESRSASCKGNGHHV